MDVYLEIAAKRTFAGAIEWPGWCRSGRDEESALKALFEYGPRYARVLRGARLGFQAPREESDLSVVERLKGTPTMEFGVPDLAPSSDTRPLDKAELAREQAILRACWRAFDAAASAAKGKELRKGPRGGGRDLVQMKQHVSGAEGAYLSRLGCKFKSDDKADLDEEQRRIRQEIIKGLAAAMAGELPTVGPRGGRLWTPRYFVRRAAWHVLDHTWEIEDRTP